MAQEENPSDMCSPDKDEGMACPVHRGESPEKGASNAMLAVTPHAVATYTCGTIGSGSALRRVRYTDDEGQRMTERSRAMARPDEHGTGGSARRGDDPSSRSGDQRQCPWCGSWNTTHVQRGYIGASNTSDQYFVCNTCQRTTFEILSRSNRDMRVSQFRVGNTVRDGVTQAKYTINRVLKVGLNEYLLYVKPIVKQDER